MNTLKITRLIIMFACVFATKTWASNKEFYGKKICHQTGYVCLEVKPRENWETLWPNTETRDTVMRINRRNMKLYAGIILAVPSSLAMSTQINYCRQASPLNFSPFPPENYSGIKTKMVMFDPRLLAWAAYGQNGQLIRWGPASGGADWCDDIKRGCHTPTGMFKIQEKHGPERRSNLFPLGCHGKTCAPIPYFMKFDRFGTGLHGSPYVPGFNDSHGCVRLFPEDAKWLNKNFTEIGTAIIVLPY